MEALQRVGMSKSYLALTLLQRASQPSVPALVLMVLVGFVFLVFLYNAVDF